MENVDNEWEQFLLQFTEFASLSASSTSTFTANQNVPITSSSEIDVSLEPLQTQPSEFKVGEYIRTECEKLYISTQTKIFYLNLNYLDVDNIFWNLPIIEYGIPKMGIIKKQMRMIFKSPEEYELYAEK